MTSVPEPKEICPVGWMKVEPAYRIPSSVICQPASVRGSGWVWLARAGSKLRCCGPIPPFLTCRPVEPTSIVIRSATGSVPGREPAAPPITTTGTLVAVPARSSQRIETFCPTDSSEASPLTRMFFRMVGELPIRMLTVGRSMAWMVAKVGCVSLLRSTIRLTIVERVVGLNISGRYLHIENRLPGPLAHAEADRRHDEVAGAVR